MKIKDRVAVVTGASSGIGEATARALAGHGARVALLARRREELQTIADSIRSSGGEALVQVVDLADAARVGECAKTIESELGVPDILVNNAGVGRWIPLLAGLSAAYG